MKKYSILISILLLCGCNKADIKKQKETEIKEHLYTMVDKIFSKEEWMNGRVKVDTYTLTLHDLEYMLGNDITLEKENNCDVNNTKVEFIVKEPTGPNKTNYEYNFILDCKIEE